MSFKNWLSSTLRWKAHAGKSLNFLDGLSSRAPEDRSLSRFAERDLDELAARSVFIVGCARSGTTIMTDALNLAPEMLLLGEAFLYKNYRNSNFIQIFNSQHVTYGNRRSKGNYIHLYYRPEPTAFHTLLRLSRRYRFVGEKVAFGAPSFLDFPEDWEKFFDFQSTYFAASRYLLIVRTPSEAVLSMSKFWPAVKPQHLLSCWLLTLKLQIDMYLSFPESRFVFFEDLTDENLPSLFGWLGISATIPTPFLRADLQATRRPSSAVTNSLAEVHAAMNKAEQIHVRLKQSFDLSSMQARDPAWFYSGAPTSFSNALQTEIEALLGVLK